MLLLQPIILNSMNRIVLFFVFAVVSLTVEGQNGGDGDDGLSLPVAHQALFKAGKSWHYMKTRKVGEDLEHLLAIVDTTYVSLTVRGDTLVDGLQCWKVNWETPDTSYLHSIWHEDGMLVYLIDQEKGNRKELVFDFTPIRGSHLPDFGSRWSLNAIDVVECWGCYYNRYYYLHADGGSDEPLLVCGIGTFNGIENRAGLYGGWNTFQFRGCYDGDDLIFSPGDFFKEASSVGNPNSLINELADGIVYDLQGRRVGQGNNVTEYQGNKLPKGIYIQNGRKVVIK